MPTTISALSRALAITALVGGLALASPLYAASSASGSSDSMSEAPASGKKMHQSMKERVETRIKTLHDKLAITPDQESAWSDVAQAMRDNEASIKGLIDDRHQKGMTMTAVEDLGSYQKIAQAHADGLSKVADAFSPLYDSMTDSQKKNADDVFGRFEGQREAPAMNKPASKTSK